jgi:hypothetical protein
MTDWLVPLTPLLVLLIVMLFRFVGCTPFSAAPTPPAPLTVVFDNPKDGEKIRGKIAPVSLTAAGGTGPYNFQVSLDSVQVHNAPSNAFTVDTTTVNNASHTFAATVTDANSVTATASVTVTVDNTVPYRDFIMGVMLPPGTVLPPGAAGPSPGDLVCYWRLIELASVGPGLATAKDEKGLEPGNYTIPPPVAGETPVSPGWGDGGAEAVPAPTIAAGQPGLIDSDPAALSRSFKGGFVRVQRVNEMYPPMFTIEAWVFPEWNVANTDYEHCLFDSREAPLGSAHGFRVFTNRNNLLQAVADPGAVRIAADEAPPVTPSTPVAPNLMSSLKRHHVALTYDGTTMTLYLNGKSVGQKPVAYGPPVSTSLFIGIANALFDQEDPEPTIPALPIRPFIGRIQEVALHKKALSAAELKTHVDINHS